MTCGVYLIRNSVNGKVYVGSSVNIEQRWRQHKSDLNKNSHHSGHLQAAWNRYGAEAFCHSILEVCSCDAQELTQSEQKFIDAYDACCECHGYNLFPNARTSAGRGPMSVEARQKMSLAKKGKPSGRKGVPVSAEHLAKMKGRSVPDAVRQRISESLLGRKCGPFTAEHRAKISAASLGKKKSESHRAAMSASFAMFTHGQVRLMSRLRKEGCSYCKIGKLFGVGRETIRKILSGNVAFYRTVI